jgi:hypothetical protein
MQNFDHNIYQKFSMTCHANLVEIPDQDGVLVGSWRVVAQPDGGQGDEDEVESVLQPMASFFVSYKKFYYKNCFAEKIEEKKIGAFDSDYSYVFRQKK